MVDVDANLSIGDAEFDILFLLEECVNGDDPHSSIQQELRFRAERFAPLQEDLEENEEAELVGLGEEESSFPFSPKND